MKKLRSVPVADHQSKYTSAHPRMGAESSVATIRSPVPPRRLEGLTRAKVAIDCRDDGFTSSFLLESRNLRENKESTC